MNETNCDLCGKDPKGGQTLADTVLCRDCLERVRRRESEKFPGIPFTPQSGAGILIPSAQSGPERDEGDK